MPKYAIQMRAILTTDRHEYEVYWIRDNKSVIFNDLLEAKIEFGNLRNRSAEMVDMTKMRIVELKKDTKFITFPDPLSIPLTSTKKGIGDGKFECDAMEFYIKIVSTPEIESLIEEVKRRAKILRKPVSQVVGMVAMSGEGS